MPVPTLRPLPAALCRSARGIEFHLFIPTRAKLTRVNTVPARPADDATTHWGHIMSSIGPPHASPRSFIRAIEQKLPDARRRERAVRVLLQSLLMVLPMAAASLAVAAPPYPTNMCAADRRANLNCTANDVEVARLQVLNNVTTCVAGQPVTLDLRAYLHLNASDRHDIGIFMAQDGKSPVIPSSSGGSGTCAVFGVPQSPSPFANLDGNACGDFDRGSLPQGVETSTDLGLVTVTCKADASGYLDIPTVISWQTGGTPTSCQAPPAAWVEPGSPSKCEAGVAARIEVQVLGRIVVTKQTVPAGAAATFAFGATGPGVAPASFTLADGQSQTLTTGPLGASAQTYVITEQQLGGWGPGAQIVCTDADGDLAPFVTVNNANRTITANMTAAFDQAFCTVTNAQQASITINKSSIGANGTFNFIGSPSIAPFAITTSAGAGQHVISGLGSGSYTVNEVVPAGWDLTALTCVDPSNDSSVNLAAATATINLAAGENVSCTFTDTARGSITVIKQSTGGDGTFAFTGPTSPTNPVGAFQITTSGGSGQVVLGNLPAGNYSVTESVPAGWDLSALACADPSGGTTTAGTAANIALAAGENVTCTFTDTRRGAIVVQKQALGADGTFNFTGTQAFAITTAGGNGANTAAFASIVPGTYTITETAQAGWTLSALSCVDPTNNSVVNLGTATASVNVAAGETVVCTFTNTRLATLTIIKQAVPHVVAPNTPVFPFTATGGLAPAAFPLSDDGVNPNSITFNDVTPGGSFTVTEAAVPNWVLTSITCTDESDPNPANRSTIDLPNLRVIPNLQPGETLRCVFTNVRSDNGAITVTKRTIGTSAFGAGGSFDFSNSGGVVGSPTNPANFTLTTTVANPDAAQALTLLAAGVYTITETPLAGWDPGPIQCQVTNGSNTTFAFAGNTAVTITLGITAGSVDGAACTFTNTRRGGITIVKAATPQDAQDFTFAATGGNGVPPSFALDDDADPTLSNTAAFAALPPASYTFTEAAVAGWRLTAIDCSGSNSVVTDPLTRLATIDLQAGESVTCIFRNAKDATITIAKTAVGGSGGETFAFSGPAALSGAIGNGQSLSGSFAAGTYSVTEQVPAGWDLTNIVCSGGSVTITGATSNPSSGFEPGDSVVNITVVPGDVVNCTYTDTRRGAITIVKNSIGADGSFNFTGSQTFAIATSAGTGQNTSAYASAVPGTYTITEPVPAGWTLTALSCSAGGSANLANATATVTLAAGQQVTCTFTNTRLGSITIVKRIHDDATTAFSFAVPAALDPALTFALTPPVQGAEISRTFSGVAPGTYTVTEQVPSGWTLIGLDCVDPSQNSSVNAAAASATINLAAGEAVTCTFDDTSLAELTISVVSTGGTGTFNFASTNLGANAFELTTPADGIKASRPFGNLKPGTYAVSGLGAPGWTLYNLQCLAESGETYWTIGGANVGITLPHGETIECIYYYRRNAAPAIVAPTPVLSPWLYGLLALLLIGVGQSQFRRRQR